MKIEEMITANRADCSGCEACANICPQKAIKMTRDAEGFVYPKINPELCTKCGKCDATCPALNFKKKNLAALPLTFVATYQDDKILRHSSAGGVFTALSEIILRDGGIVFGAAFDKNWRVVHTAAKTIDDLEKLRGSKYTQSQIGSVYQQVKDALKDKKVLFSGTPCQCAGLKHFLGSDNDNLLTVEVVCHGTPSPAVWENYIGEIGRRNEIAHVNFRSKRNGWGANLEINFFDRVFYSSPNAKDLYGKLFLSGLSERPSCQSCKFKIPNTQADLTLGDAWGIKDFAPDMFDNRGVSLVFIHSDKGKTFFEQANLKAQSVDFLESLKKNSHIISPTVADSRRKNFFADFAKEADKFAVIEKYFYDDNEEISKETRRKNSRAFNANLQELLAPLRQKFEKNILVAVNPVEEMQKKLENFFARNFQNCGLYFLTPTEDGQFTCKEILTAQTSKFKDIAALADFAKNFSLTNICVENPLSWQSEAFLDWLKNSNLPLQLFTPKV